MKFRLDIQGVRALAVLLVILYHFFPEQVPGGFIGVDIFFVISGFIITQILMRDINKTLPGYLVDFYARRMKRILPSALLVITSATIASFLLLGPITGADTARDGIYAAIFLANFHFNSLSVDYFASGLPQPILQHYWSLSIEEQFYFLWPILFFFVGRKKNLALTVIGSITAISAIIAFTNPSSNSGYFSTLNRIWELGIGAILAISRWSKPGKWASWSAMIGLTLSALFLTSENQFFGIPSATIIFLSALILLSGEGNKLLESKPMVWIGDCSYLLYLLHWPLIQIFELYKGSNARPLESLVLLFFLFTLATLTQKYFEDPIRFSSLSVRNSQNTVLAGIGAITVTLIGLSLTKGAL